MAEILVVDDNEELRQLMCTSLTLAGHNVAAATNGVAAARVAHPVPRTQGCCSRGLL
jgi:CheY-like chemotaxis protein